MTGGARVAARQGPETLAGLGVGASALALLSALAAAMALGNLLLQIREMIDLGSGWAAVAAVAVLHAAFIGCHWLPYRLADGSPLLHWVVGGQAASVVGLTVMPGSHFLTFLLFLPVVSQAQFVLTPGAGVWAAAGLWGLAVLALAVEVPAWAAPGAFWLNALSLTMGFVFAAAVSFLARSQIRLRFEVQKANEELRRSHLQLEEAHRRLVAYAQQVEELAVMRERNRLAQEIHDTLAHTLTGVIMQLEVAASLMAAGGEAGEGALEVVRRALDNARQGLADVRRTVRSLYPELLQGRPAGESLQRLASQFAEQTAVAVTFREVGEPLELPRPVVAALFRALQELLTNSGRHGRARRVDVLLEWSGSDVRLSVYDDGQGAPDFHPGFGLLSMEERAKSFGGTVRIDNRPGEGFGVTVAIPIRPAVRQCTDPGDG